MSFQLCLSICVQSCCLCVCLKALVKQRQAEEELVRLQDALTKVVNEAGARTRQEVNYSAYLLIMSAIWYNLN